MEENRKRRTVTTTFFGDAETIDAINDASHLPDDILEANPGLVTWESIFGQQQQLQA